MKSGLFGLSGSIGLNDRGWYWLFAGFFVFIWGLAMALIYLEMRGINLTVGPQDRVEMNHRAITTQNNHLIITVQRIKEIKSSAARAKQDPDYELIASLLRQHRKCEADIKQCEN